MAEPSLKDVLNAISRLEKGQAEIRGEMAKKADVDSLRAEMKKGFADLDKELTAHAGTHREIEKDIETIKRRPARTAARAPRRTRAR